MQAGAQANRIRGTPINRPAAERGQSHAVTIDKNAFPSCAPRSHESGQDPLFEGCKITSRR